MKLKEWVWVSLSWAEFGFLYFDVFLGQLDSWAHTEKIKGFLEVNGTSGCVWKELCNEPETVSAACTWGTIWLRFPSGKFQWPRGSESWQWLTSYWPYHHGLTGQGDAPHRFLAGRWSRCWVCSALAALPDSVAADKTCHVMSFTTVWNISVIKLFQGQDSGKTCSTKTY